MMTTLDELQRRALQPLEQAESLPFTAYTDRAVFDQEQDSIFANDWVFLCMQAELPEIGDYYATTLGGEPVAVLRDDDGELRALSNVCRHRGTTLLDEGFGQTGKYITCPYHAWAYTKRGSLKAIPYNELIAVDKTQHSLPEFLVACWNGLVFVNLNENAPPLEQRLQPIQDYLGLFRPWEFKEASQGATEIWHANWKLAMENAMESYHLFKVHESTLEVFSPTRDAYYVAGSSEWSVTGGATVRKQGLIEQAIGGTRNALYDHYLLVSLPPSFVGVLSYGTFGWLSAHPIDETITQIRSGATYADKSMSQSAEMDGFTKAFFLEDKLMCERVQKGMASRRSSGGKLVDMERVVVDFHQFWGTRIGGLAPTSVFEDEAAQRWKGAT